MNCQLSRSSENIEIPVDDYLEIYDRIRSRGDVLENLWRHASDLVRTDGEYGIYSEIGVPDVMIKALMASKDFEFFEEENRHESSDNRSMGPMDVEEYQNEVSSDTDDEEVSLSVENEDGNNNRAKQFSDDIGNCCDVFGREYRHKLGNSAGVLLEYGNWYAAKEHEDSMDQKLNFIRAATLINAAIERYRITSPEGKDYEKAMESLKELHGTISNASMFVKKENNFIEFCQSKRAQIAELRLEEHKKLKHIEKIRKQMSVEACSVDDEKKLISIVKQIATANTQNYIRLMNDITQECLGVMVDPPCEFVIVGLGSLAREEITLSSDFEHVIILPDETPDAEEIREYFRWFTVIFHVIIIGLGETIVPGVDIPYLCDPYSADTANNWFEDFYTPCGIAFDGMMPHACKCPLGRSRPTKNFDNVVELIQTSSVMGSFLTEKEQLKHGYMLNDVLGTTCLVYGSEEIYRSFLGECETIKNAFSQEILFSQQQGVLKDLVEKWKSSQSDALRFINVKKTLYRPITVLLHFLASHFHLRSQSSFDIVDALKSRGVIDRSTHHLLSFSVAIALELRMRCYQTKHRQRNAISYRDLPLKVGVDCLATYTVTMHFFVIAVQDFAYRRFKLKKDYNTLTFPSIQDEIWKCEMLKSSFYFSGDQEKTILELLKAIDDVINNYQHGSVVISQACYYMDIYFKCICESFHQSITRSQVGDTDGIWSFVSHIDIAKLYIWANEIAENFGLDSSTKLVYFTMRAYVLYKHFFFKNDEANRLFDRAIQLRDSLSNWSKYPWQRYAHIEVQIKCAALEPSDAIRYFEKTLKGNEITMYMTYLYKIGIAKSRWLQGLEHQANEELQDLTSELFYDSQELSREEYKLILDLLGDAFSDFKNTKYQEGVLDMKYEILDHNLPGEFPGQSDLVAKLNTQNHYRYNFGRTYNFGRYANFTFMQSDYDDKLPLLLMMLNVKMVHTSMIISSVRYDDILPLVKFSQEPKDLNTSYLRNVVGEYPKKCLLTKSIAIMVLCESVEYRDLPECAELLLKSPDIIIMLKILQPFIYGFFVGYVTHPASDLKIIDNQSVLFRYIFQTNLPTDASYNITANKAITLYTNLEFSKSANILWNLLQLHAVDIDNHEILEELFLTVVYTVMILRKREKPFLHLAKCREMSLMQSLWLRGADLGENREYYLFDPCFQLSSFYHRCSDRYSQIYNFAVNCVVYDERACAAILWKLIYSGKLNFNLCGRCMLLLFEALDLLCEETLTFSYIHRL